MKFYTAYSKCGNLTIICRMLYECMHVCTVNPADKSSQMQREQAKAIRQNQSPVHGKDSPLSVRHESEKAEA